MVDLPSAMSPAHLREKKVVVLGLATTGRAVARVLSEAGAHVLASDAGAPSGNVVATDVEWGSHDRAVAWIADADLVVPSPGIPPHAPVLVHALELGIPVRSEIEVASWFTDAQILAVTGTNGKTTTCRIAGAMLREGGRDAVVCGNIGDPFIAAAADRRDADVFVVEVSSFHLFFCESFHPRVAIVTNFAPDHLDWHGSMDDYRAAKVRISQRQEPGDTLVYPADEPAFADLAPVPGPRRVPFSLDAPVDGDGVWAEDGTLVARIEGLERRVSGMEQLMGRGRPFAIDALAAGGACLALGVPTDSVERTLRTFRPDHHRMEVVEDVRGVRFVDDSKATNPHAALAAIRSFDRVVLIAGGRNKGLDLSVLASESDRLRGVVAIGDAAPEVLTAFAQTDVPSVQVTSMQEAVERAFGMASTGDVVLLSPACASFDWYENYAQRGDDFRARCTALSSEENG